MIKKIPNLPFYRAVPKGTPTIQVHLMTKPFQLISAGRVVEGRAGDYLVVENNLMRAVTPEEFNKTYQYV